MAKAALAPVDKLAAATPPDMSSARRRLTEKEPLVSPMFTIMATLRRSRHANAGGGPSLEVGGAAGQDIAARMAAANSSMSCSVVSQEHIHRTSPTPSSQK
ncbi:hypothetical protein GCM10022376_22590 [Yimella lutea]